MTFAIIVIALAFCLLPLILLKTYRHIPVRELKTRAREGDEIAALLHCSSAYESSLTTLLLIISGISGSWFVWLLGQNAVWWVAVPVTAALFWVSLILKNILNTNRWVLKFAALASPSLAWILEYLHPLFYAVYRRQKAKFHTGLFNDNDLMELLKTQGEQTDSRIEQSSLNIAINSLNFSRLSISDIMTPWRKVKKVSASDSLGPVLMSELHNSGQQFFPVFEGKRSNIVGVLSLNHLTDTKRSGVVRDAMHQSRFLREETPLSDTLETILQPDNYCFLATDDEGARTGVVTAETILRQIINQPEPEDTPGKEPAEPEPETEEQTPVYGESMENV